MGKYAQFSGMHTTYHEVFLLFIQKEISFELHVNYSFKAAFITHLST